MKLGYLVAIAGIAVALVGCEKISKPYIMTVDRTDQVVQGNKGYLQGTPPPSEERVGLKRSLIAVDMDLIQIQGKPAPETVLVTKQGKKTIFPKTSDSDEEKNIK
ncbi:MAG: hypothetical protein PHX20_02315 [Candidatus Omnitrophica bacterium]|nr:hypothetical protein [Candidatus Omnitrophota bacterium]MDD5436355.1 hypothetical protein [Candidatus Omnitrophota bacterium]